MDRVENWDSCLVRLARAVEGQPFEWGRTDCATLARRGLTTIYGRDVWAGHVGTWKTRRGALGSAGRTDPENALRASGAVPVPPNYAWSGDVALGASLDAHGMPRVSLLLPNRKALTSTPDRGVVVVDKLSLTEGTEFWSYVWSG